jgi:hypothetical protein
MCKPTRICPSFFFSFKLLLVLAFLTTITILILTVGYCSPQIRPVFEKHGNVVEVVILKDKRTGQQQGIEMQIFFLSIL